MRGLRIALVFLLLATVASGGAVAGDSPLVESGRLTTADGNAMVYEVRGAANEDEPTLVFVHCWACDRSVWNEQVDVFAESHHVVTFDLPGHGESGAQRASWTLDGLAADTVQLVAALDLDDLVFVGHSMGGPVSLLAAAKLAASADSDEGHSVRGIVCADTLHDLEMKPPEEQSKQWVAMFENDFEGSLANMMAMTLPGDENGALRASITEVAIGADRTAVLELMKDYPSLELAEKAAVAGVPLRCINAARMQNGMPPDAVERSQRHADYQLTVMEDVGHFLQLEKPAEFNEALRQALASIESAGDD